MTDKRSGIIALGLKRLRETQLTGTVQKANCRHIQAYLRFHNEPQNAARVPQMDAAEALRVYMRWLGRQQTVSKRDLLLARRAILFLYAEVFRAPLNRP